MTDKQSAQAIESVFTPFPLTGQPMACAPKLEELNMTTLKTKISKDDQLKIDFVDSLLTSNATFSLKEASNLLGFSEYDPNESPEESAEFYLFVEPSKKAINDGLMVEAEIRAINKKGEVSLIDGYRLTGLGLVDMYRNMKRDNVVQFPGAQ